MSSSSSSHTAGAPSSSTPPRPQADPLPSKIGELDYMPVVNPDSVSNTAPSVSDTVDMAPGPHPAESITHSSITTNDTPPVEPHDTASIRSKKSFVRMFLRGDPSKPMPAFHGVRLSTLLRVIIIICALIGTVVGWAVTSVVIHHRNAQRTQPTDPSNTTPSPGTSDQSAIFIHVAFGLITVLLLIFLERAVFLARAERYRHIHELEMSGSRSRSMNAHGNPVDPTTMAFAPWNRPPLPTYANALGFRGTGDVEDAAIAVPPPPEYGNTRGSTLLLSNMLQRASLRGRPVSYTSRIEVSSPVEREDVEDDDDAEASNARRARRLEESLAALEREAAVSVPAPAVLRK